MLGGVKWTIIGIASVAVLAAVGAAFLHYRSVLSENATLRENNVKLETAVDLQGATIDAQAEAIGEWEAAQEAFVDRLEELEAVQRQATAETRRLTDVFSRHDLGDLARRKPGLVERRVDDGSDRARRLLECATGAGGADCPD